MHYIATFTDQGLEVRFSEGEKIQNEINTQAENIFGTEIIDLGDEQIIIFKSKKQFKNFLFWREIFNEWNPNKRFCFMSYARRAAKQTRNILNNNVIFMKDVGYMAESADATDLKSVVS